ncbi:carbohydrate esterase family 3 protein [Xylariaceae sp. FL0016]|nr:carbohydrate esterase family 3 protein [Xylariaceae sp. FL0016]
MSLESAAEKSPRTWASRLWFLRTKRAIAAYTLLTCGIIVVIALTATGVIHAQDSGGSGSKALSASTTGGPSSTAPTAAVTTQAGAVSSTGTVTSVSATPTTSSAKATSTATQDVPLRIMALGASIVKGETSPGYLGFRKPMRDELVEQGFAVNMVGSVRLGDFVDNDVEAYGGKKITEMQNYATKVVPETQPNLFVLNLGTNNILQNKDVDKTGEQMKELIEYLLSASNRSTVILSTLLINNVPNKEPMVLDVNSQYRDVVKTLEADGKPVVLAEMHPDEGVADVPTAADIGSDGSHPTVAGYELMAKLFVKAIQEAHGQGLLQQPFDNGIADDGDAERSG